MNNKLDIKIKLCVVVLIIFSIILPNTIVYGYTVDDVRDIIGKARIDETFTENEIVEIVKNYENIERANLIAKMFEIGKSIDMDRNTQDEYVMLDKEISELKEKFVVGFRNGTSIKEVLTTKTELETSLHKVDALKERKVYLEIGYVENTWASDYLKVQEMIEKMSKDYEIGKLGEGMRSPVYSGFVITSPFGFRLDPITKSEVSFHNGLDLAAKLDDPILAQWNGVVSNVYESETGGKTVEITHGEGLVTKYLHLNSTKVNIGQEVRQYEVIGGAGSTGTRSTGPHLHLTIELDGEKINPIYLYGSMGLNEFKTYLSYNPERNRELPELESNLKSKPTKKGEVVEDTKLKYERSPLELKEGDILSREALDTPEINTYNSKKGINWKIVNDVGQED